MAPHPRRPAPAPAPLKLKILPFLLLGGGLALALYAVVAMLDGKRATRPEAPAAPAAQPRAARP